MQPSLPDPEQSHTAPRRIQLRRTKGWRKPEGAVVVSRPSKWGNPYKVGGPTGPWAHSVTPSGRVETVEQAVELYRQYASFIKYVPIRPAARPHQGIYTHGVESLAAHARRKLNGRDLACWCPLFQPCHADVLLRIANEATTT